jgi:hypothetical protein
MRPGDLVFWEDTAFGHHHFWRIESVLWGSVETEALVRLVSLSHNAGADENGERQRTLLVPEVLIRGKVYLRDQ